MRFGEHQCSVIEPATDQNSHYLADLELFAMECCLVRNEEATASIPVSSTILRKLNLQIEPLFGSDPFSAERKDCAGPGGGT